MSKDKPSDPTTSKKKKVSFLFLNIWVKVKEKNLFSFYSYFSGTYISMNYFIFLMSVCPSVCLSLSLHLCKKVTTQYRCHFSSYLYRTLFLSSNLPSCLTTMNSDCESRYRSLSFFNPMQFCWFLIIESFWPLFYISNLFFISKSTEWFQVLWPLYLLLRKSNI